MFVASGRVRRSVQSSLSVHSKNLIKTEMRVWIRSLTNLVCAKDEKLCFRGAKGDRGEPGEKGLPGTIGRTGKRGPKGQKGKKATYSFGQLYISFFPHNFVVNILYQVAMYSKKKKKKNCEHSSKRRERGKRELSITHKRP